MDNKQETTLFHKLTQVLLPILTIVGFMLTSFKRPDLGLIFNLLAQIFWLYASWQAWKNAKQVGIFITSLIITLLLIYGVINYWFF